MELTILMPCLNEAETLQLCIRKAQKFLQDNKIKGEVLIADNGSSDGSIEIAEVENVRVVHVADRGYGAALIKGTKAAYGKYVIMGDADDSYDFLNLMPFMEKLREGYDLVMGDRFKGGIEKGAMPPLHKYLGNPVLSFLGRLFYKSDIRDFHCGLRGYNKKSIEDLQLITTGMEYASEMVVKATLHQLRIAEVPTTLKRDGRSRKPHLRSWQDGWRHLKFLLLYSPNWLFLYPGWFLISFGMILSIVLLAGPMNLSGVKLDIHTLLYAAAMQIVGIDCLLFSVFTKAYAYNTGYIPIDRAKGKFRGGLVEKCLLLGIVAFLVGILISVIAMVFWKEKGFGELIPQKMMRITIPAFTMIVIGIKLIFAGFFTGILNISINRK